MYSFYIFPKILLKIRNKDQSRNVLLGGDSKIGIVNHVNNSANQWNDLL